MFRIFNLYDTMFVNIMMGIEFNEIEKDAITGLRKMKHLHIYNAIAKKK